MIFVFVSSSSPAGGSPVRVAARRPGSRLRLVWKQAGLEPSVKGPVKGGATMRSVAWREACGVVTQPSFGAGKGVPSLSESGRRPWKRRRAWKRSREGLPGVWGTERIEGGGGNWGGPPRPGDLRCCHRSAASCNRRGPGSGWLAGWASEAAVVRVEPGPGRGDPAGTGCGQPSETKMSSAGGCPSWQTMVSVGISIVPSGPCPPPEDTPGASPAVTT